MDSANTPPDAANTSYTDVIILDDGDHLILTVEEPHYVTARGRVAGETFDLALHADTAQQHGRHLIDGTTDNPLWELTPARAASVGGALIGAARHASPTAVNR